MINESMISAVKQVGNQIVVETRIHCVEDVPLVHRTIWTLSTDRLHLALKCLELGIGTLFLTLETGPVPAAHVAAARAFASEHLGTDVAVDTAVAEIQKEVQRVFLVSREGSCEAFLDEVSARFWAGVSSDIRNVSLRAASSALKTDEQTVIESATAATRSTCMEIRAAVGLLHAAECVRKRFESAGIPMDKLQAGLVLAE